MIIYGIPLKKRLFPKRNYAYFLTGYCLSSAFEEIPYSPISRLRGIVPVPCIALRYDLFSSIEVNLNDIRGRITGSKSPYKGDQFVIDPVCPARGHLRNDFHTVGLSRSIDSDLGYALQGQDDASCH